MTTEVNANMITLATSKDETAPNLFDKKGKNYIDCLLEFVDNAKAGTVSVDDIQDLEARFKRLQEAIKNAEEQMVLIENLQADLIKQLSERTIKHFADGVQKYFKQSGYLDNLDTEIQKIYMQRWSKHIVEYIKRNHIPLLHIDIEKLSEKVAKYLLEHYKCACECCSGRRIESGCEYCDYNRG